MRASDFEKLSDEVARICSSKRNEFDAELESANSEIAELKRQLKEANERAEDRADEFRIEREWVKHWHTKALELQAELEAERKDAESWRSYKKRKDEVIAAGMGRKILRDAAIEQSK